MSKNIKWNFFSALLFCAGSLIFTSCGFASSQNAKKTGSSGSEADGGYSAPKIVGMISSNEITESSGLVNSRCDPNVFWTHNDSGGGEFIFALSEKGERLGTWRVVGAHNNDWEDLAAVKDRSGRCFLYIGDIGNNGEKKNTFAIYKVTEPVVTEADKSSSKKRPSQTEPAETIGFTYPDSAPDAETLLVHPMTGEIYVLTKTLLGASEVYRVGAKTEKVGSLSVPAVPNGFLTGGEISPDGQRIVICDYYAAYEFNLPKNAKKFDEIWKQQEVTKVELGEREQGEAVCYSSDGKKIYATSEKKNSPVIRVERKK